MVQSTRDLRPRCQSGVQRALREFLIIPLTIIAGMVVLGVAASVLDHGVVPGTVPVQHALAVVLAPSQTDTMLTTVAPGMLTALTISFFLLLTLIQRMAGTFTWVVIGQFFMNRTNQAFVGFFGGLPAYFIVVLATVQPPRSVISTAVGLVLSVLALASLIVFGYLVLDQMRPTAAVQRIIAMTLKTRATQAANLRCMRSAPELPHLPAHWVHAERSGFIIKIDTDILRRATSSVGDRVEIEFRVGLGSHLVKGSKIACVRADDPSERHRLGDAVLDAITCGRERRLDRDAVYGVHQLSSMAWASAKGHDPEAALVAIAGLDTLLAQWTAPEDDQPPPEGGPLPVVYFDTQIEQVLSSLSNIVVASAAAGQAQTCAGILELYASMLGRLSAPHQRLALAQLADVLPEIESLTFTPQLKHALTALDDTLDHSDPERLALDLSGLHSRMSNNVSGVRQ